MYRVQILGDLIEIALPGDPEANRRVVAEGIPDCRTALLIALKLEKEGAGHLVSGYRILAEELGLI